MKKTYIKYVENPSDPNSRYVEAPSNGSLLYLFDGIEVTEHLEDAELPADFENYLDWTSYNLS